MPAARDDYLMRLIQQTTSLLKSFRERLGSGDAFDSVSSDASAAISALLGPQRPLLDKLDGWSAANLLGDPERLQLWSELLTLQSDIARASGHATTGDALAARAADLAKHVPALQSRRPA